MTPVYCAACSRTARGFLLIAPPAFLVALAVFLLTHGRAAESFSPYPFLLDALGPSLVRRPVGRFAAAATLFFVVPYLVTALLLLSDAGLGAAAHLWKTGGRAKAAPAPPQPRRRLPPEALVVLTLAALLLSGLAGLYLDRVAHGGELPGGVNVAPFLVAGIPFLAIGLGLVLATVASLPRAAARILSRQGGKKVGTGPAERKAPGSGNPRGAGRPAGR